MKLVEIVRSYVSGMVLEIRGGNLGKLFVRLLKLYGIFAVFNVLSKIYTVVYNNARSRRLWRHVPGDNLDTFGSDLARNAHRFHSYYRDQALKHPNANLIKSSAPLPEIICNSPESIKWMLKDEFPNVTKPKPGQDYLWHLMGEFIGDEGIFVLRHGEAALGDRKLQSENEKWFKERKVASRIFTKANFDGFMYKTFVEKAEKVVKRLENVCKSKEKIDMQEIFFSFTMDSIEKLFFGKDVNTVEGGMSNYGRAFDTAHQSMMAFVTKTVAMQVANRFILPYPFGKLGLETDEHNIISTQLVRFFSPDIKKYRKAIDDLDKDVYEYIKKTRNDPKLAERTDIIANFLNSKFGGELSDKMLRDIVLNLTIAGRDTTACALSWLFYEFSQNPECQAKLYSELKEKLNGRIPTVDELEPDNLPYLNGCLYEALRLHPPVPTESKVAQKDLTYLDGTVIPKGTVLFYLPFAVGRNPTYFKDPAKFNPNRWIPFADHQKTLFEFPVFQAGPRFCLGKDMAQFEAKLLTSIIMQRFTFDLLPGEAEKIWYSLSLTMAVSNSPTRETHNLWMLPKDRQAV